MPQVPAANPDIQCPVLLQDDGVLALNKPAGTVTLPGLGHARDSLLNGAMALDGAALEAVGEERDWGLLHRLDRETSGVVLLARTARSYDALRAQFEARTVAKTYLAVVRGRLPRPHGTCREALDEVRRGQRKISVPRRGALEAITHWRVLASAGQRALVACAIETGRLHQIRAHLAWLGAPVEGDSIYRSLLPPNTSAPRDRAGAPPLLLHAWRVGFQHPVHNHTRVDIEAPLDGALRTAAESCAGGPTPLAQLLEPVRCDWWIASPAGGRPGTTRT